MRLPPAAALARHLTPGCGAAWRRGDELIVRERSPLGGPLTGLVATAELFLAWAATTMGWELATLPLERRVAARRLERAGAVAQRFRAARGRWPETFAELAAAGAMTADAARQLDASFRWTRGEAVLVRTNSFDDVLAIAFERSAAGPWLLLTEGGRGIEGSGARTRRDLAEVDAQLGR